MSVMAERLKDRVPVEHRLLGMDKRSFPFAIVALLVLALWAWVLPWINDSVAVDDPIETGDVLQIAPDVTMDPIPGWNLDAGLRTSDQTLSGTTFSNQTVLDRDGVSIGVLQGGFTGSLPTLLKQINKITSTTTRDEGFHVTSPEQPITTAAGLDGLIEGYQSTRVQGLVAAFIAGPTGIQVRVTGPADQIEKQREAIYRMIDSIDYAPQGDAS